MKLGLRIAQPNIGGHYIPQKDTGWGWENFPGDPSYERLFDAMRFIQSLDKNLVPKHPTYP